MSNETSEQKIARLRRELSAIQDHDPPRLLGQDEVKRRNAILDELQRLGAFDRADEKGAG